MTTIADDLARLEDIVRKLDQLGRTCLGQALDLARELRYVSVVVRASVVHR